VYAELVLLTKSGLPPAGRPKPFVWPPPLNPCPTLALAGNRMAARHWAPGDKLRYRNNSVAAACDSCGD
jgi:hypothetical protein